SRMNKIQEIVERLDKATNQVMIESKFIEVTKNDVKDIGVDWTSLGGYSASAGPFQRQYEEVDSDNDESTRESSNSTEFETGEGTTTTISDSISDTFTQLATSSTTDTAVFSADQFEVILSALKTNNDIKLVSNPTVVTLDNKEAKIAIGERYPIPTYTFNAETGQRQLDEIEYEDIGINLDVTPQVNSAGFINLAIIPEVSSRLGFAIVENTEIPIIASRRTETNIMIKDGFTLAIGGLVENETSTEGSKVPLLGDLPGVGRLFKSDRNSTEQRNLIIFITAKTLNPDGSTYRDIIDPRVLDEMQIEPSELPGYEIPEDQMSELERLEAIRFEEREAERAAKTRARIKQHEYRQMQAEEEARSR
ncbi:MAG: type II secretion system protein GspD, partial [Opitutales bacterium]